MTDTEFTDLVIAVIDGDPTAAQRAALNAELARSSVRRAAYLRQARTSLMLEERLAAAAILGHRSSAVHHRPVPRRLAVAAGLLVCVGVGLASVLAVHRPAAGGASSGTARALTGTAADHMMDIAISESAAAAFAPRPGADGRVALSSAAGAAELVSPVSGVPALDPGLL